MTAEPSNLSSATTSDASLEPCAPKLLFVLGAPRSGTSWIQKCLSAQPGWITAPELHYAADVLKPVLNAWDRRATKLEQVLTAIEGSGRQSDRLIGLPASVEFDDLVTMLRDPIEKLVARASHAFGEVHVFIEKTPSNSVLAPYLSGVFPESHMLHIVRDPRAMVRSLRSAGVGWGSDWAPRSPLVCALIWRGFVAGARRAETVAAHYLEVRYEDAQHSLTEEMSRISAWLGVSEPPVQDETGSGARRHELVSSRVARTIGPSEVGEPEGFGDGSGSRPHLSRRQLWLVELVTASLMESFGYSVHFRTAKWINRLLEKAVRRPLRSLSPATKETLVLYLPMLRLPRRRSSVHRFPEDRAKDD